MGTRISYHFMDIDIVEYYVGNINVVKGCAIKAATHETFDHFFLASRVQCEALPYE